MTVETLTWRGHVAGAIDNGTLHAVTTSSEIAGDAGDLYLAVISVKPARTVDSVSGLGLTWTKIREQCGGRDTARVAIFWAFGPSTSGRVTVELAGGVDFSGSSVLAVHRYSGANATVPIGNVTSANTNGRDAAATCSNGSDTADYHVDTPTSSAGSIVFVGVHTANFTHTPGAGFNEREDLQSGTSSTTAGVAVEELSAMTAQPSVTGTFSGKPDWSAIAVELRD